MQEPGRPGDARALRGSDEGNYFVSHFPYFRQTWFRWALDRLETFF
jgi:hypothetical protein